jgi:hypothetical protein
MLRLGEQVTIPSLSDLAVDIDDDLVRLQLGGLIGIEEIVRPPQTGTLLNPQPQTCFAPMFSGAKRDQQPHFPLSPARRAGDRPAIRATLPYFLGAIPADYTLKQQQLVSLKRDLRRTDGELREANRINEDIDFEVRSLLTEAYARGLIDTGDQTERDDAIATLRSALEVPVEGLDDVSREGERVRELLARRTELRDKLRELLDQRAFLTKQERTEEQYLGAASAGAARLRTIELIPGHVDSDPAVCPTCATALSEFESHALHKIPTVTCANVMIGRLVRPAT